MRKLILLALLFCTSITLLAQQSPPPDLSAGLVAQAAYKGWLEGQISSLWQQLTGVQAATANVPQDEANILTLQQQHVADAAAILTLQQQVTTMQGQITQLQGGTPPMLSPVYELAVSLTPDRANPVNLNGATVTGNVYIYSAAIAVIGNDNPLGVISVSYWLDNPAMTGTATHVESVTPFDFVGGTSSVALPWNSASVPNGQHSITQKITLASGSEVDTATFTVAN